MTSFSSFAKYANSFQAVVNPGLGRVAALLQKLGDPQRSLRCIHVAGTNGKGSVCAFLDAIFRAAGARVGCYTSPNLVRVNERITLCGAPISDADLDALLQKVQVASDAVEAERGECPTQFEIWTAAAFLYFAQEKCDPVILEVGLGGELDATNVIEQCAISVITHLDLDHTALLGSTLAEVARAKAGIIKEGCPVLTTVQAPEAHAVIAERATACHAPLTVVTPPPPGAFTGLRERLTYGEVRDLPLALCGAHQIENACLAAEAARMWGLPGEVIAHGLASARHPGRMEVLRESPLLLYDGGHNPDGIAALTASLTRYLPQTAFVVIFACMADKDCLPSLQMLAPHAARFLFTTVQENPRAESPEGLCARAAAGGIAGETVPTLAEAIARAGDAPTLICGSLYLYKDLPPLA